MGSAQSKNVIVQSGCQFNISSHFHWKIRTRKNIDLSKFTIGQHLLNKILTTWKFIQNWILLNFTIFLYDWKMERFWTLKVTVRKIQIFDFFLFFDNIHKVQNISYPYIPYDDFTSDSTFEKWDSVLYHAEIFRKEKWKQSFLLIDFPQFSQKCTKNERFSHLCQ